MKSRSRYLVFILLILVLILSACSPEDMEEIEDILDPENAEPSEAQREQMAGEGSADVYYHYYSKNPDFNFEIDMPFKVNFAETNQGGSFDAQGMYQDLVTFSMAANNQGERCMYTCTVNLKYVATGSIEMDEEGNCEIPMNFSFTPQGDFLLDGDCSESTMNVVDCNLLTVILMDPTTYTFLKTDTELHVPSGKGVTREAEIKNLVFPKDMAGTCKW